MIKRYMTPEMQDLWSDKNKFDTWLALEIYACEAWEKLEKIPGSALEEIKKKASYDIFRIEQIEAEVHHDVIAFLTSVSEKIGPSGKFVHYGLTSSDVVDTSLAVLLKRSAEILIPELERLIDSLKKTALEHSETVMVGRTHGVHAEPMTLGLKMAVWFFEMKRNLDRLKAARETISYGKLSGAVGAYTTIDPFVEEYVCDKLGLRPASASSQVLQRDRHAAYLTAIAITGSSLEKIATEIRALQKTEVSEAEEPFAPAQKGSSAMPHKKNPIISERICGLARILRGNALVSMENVALWHERDISHSSAERIVLPDSTSTLHYMLKKMIWLIDGLVVNKRRMHDNLNIKGGIVFSQKVLLALIDAGMLRETAYRLVQKYAMMAHRGEGLFSELIREDNEISQLLSEDTLSNIFDTNQTIIASQTVIDRVRKETG